MKNTKIPRINPAKRLLYGFVGLLAGDLILLFFLLQHALHATILAGKPVSTIADTVQTFILYADGKDKMPSYKKSLKPDQVKDLVGFVRSLAKK